VTASPRPHHGVGGANHGDIRAGKRYIAGRCAVEGPGVRLKKANHHPREQADGLTEIDSPNGNDEK
jgi:hypothetical protein